MNRKVMQIYKSVSEHNDKLIESGEEIQPMAFIIEKNGKVGIIGMGWSNGLEKEAHKQALLKTVSGISGVLGYILIQDALMTKIDKKTNKHETIDVVMRSIFTPKEKMIESIIYKDKKIVERMKVSSKDEPKGNTTRSEWNLWETTPDDTSANDEYERIKRENPEDYRSVA